MSQSDFELKNFSSLLLQEVTDAIAEERTSAFREVAFTDIVMDYFSDAEETGNCQICTSIQRNKAGNRQRQLNGYGIWDDYETLDLFITDYKGTGEIYTIDKNKIVNDFNLCLKYLKYAQKDDFGSIEDSAPEIGFLSNFKEFIDRILRIRIILITDGLARAEAPAVIDKSGEPTIFFEIWDIQRVYQVWSAQGKREAIEIDIPAQFGHKIECITVDQEEDNYSAYLTVVPAELLADLYNIYGTRLLEQNVRVYLQNLGKVNKEIRKTILDSPGMFMAYNNGISATVTEIVFEENSAGNNYIKSIKGLQIVNGGQTTSSIYYARKKDRASLKKIHVQMKITKVHDDRKMESVVSQISKYANSQNKVSEIDLTSNQPFQMKLEELSRTTWATSPDNSNIQIRWYYERVKGQYKEELNKEHTTARKNSFKIKNPTNQVLRKEEFAKYRNSWKMLPYWVARGSQKNYLQMIAEENKTEPSRNYFKDTVCVAKLFKKAEELYGKKPNSMGDLRYLVVPYSISWLNYHTSGRLDLSQIWDDQILSKELISVLKQVLLKVNNYFQTEKPGHFALISEWAKREECWDRLLIKSPVEWDIDFTIIKRNLTDQAKLINAWADSSLSAITALSVSQWEEIELSGRERLSFSLIQINTIRNVITRLKKDKPFSEQLISQASELLEIYKGAMASSTV